MYIHIMNVHSHILIVGGGLAGLTCAIHLAKENIPVTLIEKDSYPKHKVCGEYISNEILPYFDFLGIDLKALQPVNISGFKITTQNGDAITATLPLGGFGVSRYALDFHLWKIAKQSGVQLINDQVIDVTFDNGQFTVKTSSDKVLTSKYVIGAFGKRSGVDKVLQRKFILEKSPWLAVKMHFQADFDKNRVELHNFNGGYCGLSKVENGSVNACYLVSYHSFKKHKDINTFQQEVMYKNKHLQSFFKDAVPLFDKPLTISQVYFDSKDPVEGHIFMLGDAAGLIHPLCGNGMAMAIQSAQILADLLKDDYSKISNLSRKQIENLYTTYWKATFSKRLRAGRALQRVLLNKRMQKASYLVAKILPGIVPRIIKQTHGEPLIC